MEAIPPNVPSDALAIFFIADNGKKGTYFLWKKTHRGVTLWYWHALGNDGNEDNAFDATYAARNWIRDGVSSIPVETKTKIETTNSGDNN